MKLSLILFISGLVLIVLGYTKQLSPACNEIVTTKVVPRHVYDEILRDSTIDEVYDELLRS